MALTSLPPGSRLVSLRQRFLWLLIGVVGLFAAGMALSLAFSLYSNKVAEESLLNLEATQTRASVIRRLDYYQELVDNLARDPILIELMRAGSTENRQQWASSHSHLIPNLMELSLANSRGELDGKASHAGKAAQHDGSLPGMRSRGESAVNRSGSAPAQIDMVSEVRGTDNVVLGTIQASFRLDQLQRIIDDSLQPGHAIFLVDSTGKPVVSQGELHGATHEVSVSLPAGRWRLIVQSPMEHFSYSAMLQIVAGMLTLAGVLILLIMVVMRLRRPVMQDIDAVLDALASLTRNEAAPLIVTRYAEFAPAAAAINRIAQQLQDQREQLATLSLTDVLTGLPNRRAFEAQFSHMLGLADRGHAITLVLLDVDHFKNINDRLGHAAGDQALVALANTLKALTRSADMTARLAGDEFTALLSGLDNEGVMAWYQRLADRFRSELRASGLDVDNTISAGQTWLQSMAGDSIGKALARADQALYQAKARGRGQLVLNEAVGENDAG